MKPNHNNNFNLIRLIAATLVLITHSYTLTNRGEADILSRLTCGSLSFSYTAVATFFCISGYLIFQSAIHSTSAYSFFFRRILRIIPGLLGVLLFTVFVLGPIFTTLPLSVYFTSLNTYKHLLSVFIYIQNFSIDSVFTSNPNHAVNGSLWTLKYEFSCYIICFISVYLGLHKKRALFLLVLIFMLAVRIFLGNRFFWFDYASPLFLWHNMRYINEWFWFFLSGMVFYMYKDSIRISGLFFVTTLLIYVVFALFKQEQVLRIISYITIPTCVFYLYKYKHPESAFLGGNDFSYGIYIYGFPVQQTLIFITNNTINIYTLIFLSVLLTLPLSFLSWFFIEKRALKHKNYIQ
jgi:peptidoglycan/LPS O-acetylase OafA/YrhL